MPMLRRGYGAVKNLRCKSGARFPPSTVLGVSTVAHMGVSQSHPLFSPGVYRAYRGL